MMNKYKFSTTERFVLWKSYDYKCFWCGEPLEYKQTTIDHLFPEKLLSEIDELERVKRAYSLPSNFEVNDFCNWVPAHNNCNAKKSIRLIRKSPMFLLSIEEVQKKAIAVKKTFKSLDKRISKDKVIARLLTDLEKGNISSDDLMNLLESTSIYYLNMPNIRENELSHLPQGWKVMSIDRKTGRIRVTNGKIAGEIPIDIEPDHSWRCPVCHGCGPWDGNKCCICGHHSFPD
jgi:hypothetical protein